MKAKQQITLPLAAQSITARIVWWGCIASAEGSKERLIPSKPRTKFIPPSAA